MSIVVRTANPADGEAVVQVMSQAFHRPPGTDKYNRDQSALQREPENYCVLEQNGHILGAFHVARHRIQIGSCIITKADIGEVSIHPDHQGKSLGSHMMQEAVSWMKQAGFHLSRLGGYNRFYQRFGWTPFVRGFIEFPLSGLTSRGGHTDPEEMLRPQHPDHIRPYHPEQDADACAHLYAIFNHNRTGAPPPDTKSFPNSGPLHPWHLVYESQGKVQAYLFASATDADHNRFNTRVSFHDAAVDPADPTPFGHLLRHTLLEAHRYGTTTVSARLPLDPALHAIYRDYSLGFIATIWQTTESGNMLQILHLQALIDTLLP
ncbi:MAG: GNAT family N-acetyltransferase, partial [bacterium]|nr:GNAT family N-acetyltransferase [bacterium]